MQRRHETPLKRVNPSGRTVWVARYTGRDGKRRSAGTFELKREAQAAIDAAYERDAGPVEGTVTVGGYFERWLERYPRSDRTNATYRGRVECVLDVEIDGRRFRDWPLAEVRRRQVSDLVNDLLRVQGRAASGAQGVLSTLSAMWQNALDDDRAESNPFRGVTVRLADPRVRKPPRRVRVWRWEQMHALAAAGAVPVPRDPDRVPVKLRGEMERRWHRADEWRAVYAEAMLRTLSDVGLRLGELLPLERTDVKLGARCDEEDCWFEEHRFEGPHLHVRRTAWKARVFRGTKTDHGAPVPGRAVPLPPVLAGMLAGLPRRIDTRLLFPTTTGCLFSETNFVRDVWAPARAVSGVDATRHEFRHSYVSLMRAAGVDPADLAAWTGHTVLTATARYTHSMGLSAEAARKAVGP